MHSVESKYTGNNVLMIFSIQISKFAFKRSDKTSLGVLVSVY